MAGDVRQRLRRLSPAADVSFGHLRRVPIIAIEARPLR